VLSKVLTVIIKFLLQPEGCIFSLKKKIVF
jgi:hypothetical protein